MPTHERLEGKIAMQLLIFQMAKETFGFRLPDVAEVVGGINIVALPRVAPPFEGIFQLRGRIVALLDLRHAFHPEASGKTKESEILVLESGLAVRVPGLVESAKVELEHVQPSSEDGIGAVLDGIVCENQRIYHVLSVTKLLAYARKLMIQSEEASRAAGG